jgi:ACS family tartrate transporter-like MFS transporter
VALAAAVSGTAFIATAFVTGLVPSLVLLSIAMLGITAMLGPFWTLATSFVHGAGAAAGIALINSVGNVGGFVGPYGIGSLRDATNSYSAGLIAIGVVVVLGGALVLTVPDGRRRRDTAQNRSRSRSVRAR